MATEEKTPQVDERVLPSDTQRRAAELQKLRDQEKSTLAGPISSTKNIIGDFLTGFGTGIQGGNAATASMNQRNAREGQRKNRLAEFSDQQQKIKQAQFKDPNSEDSLKSVSAALESARAANAALGNKIDDETIKQFFSGKSASDISKLDPIKTMFDIAKLQQKDREIIAENVPVAKEDVTLTALKQGVGASLKEWMGTGKKQYFANSVKLTGAMSELTKAKDAIFGGNISGPGFDRIRTQTLNSKSFEVQRNIESAVIGTLRPMLGAQFTENEGKRILAQTFDPNQKEEVNFARIELLQNIADIGAKEQEAMLKHILAGGSITTFHSDQGFSELKNKFFADWDATLTGKTTKKETKDSPLTIPTDDDINKMSEAELRVYLSGEEKKAEKKAEKKKGKGGSRSATGDF